ncbi:protein-cysteine N-palmitoyltransferase HHAT-like protein [Centruroides sculpturatus]|uniref:protein-cysteine N-palmitoyltransferase HHAT-like protein n=1 Tax=Centruroides sculpturatus TaxID=218467 RepID=UPI000C6E8447|nr:protein-cysteine N-palmitoyltransferase HHAT-like protein [Centruroides sculpturatus]
MKLEIFYWIIWSGSCCYSLYCFSKESSRALPSLYSGDFQKGWKILNRKQDISDSEWMFFKNAINLTWIWIVGQIITTQIFLRKNCEYLSLFYSVYSVAFFINFIGIIPTLFYLSCICFTYMICKTSNQILCLTIAVCALYATSYSHYGYIKKIFIEDETKSFLFDIGLGWLMARCVSFSVDKINGKVLKFSFEEIVGIIAYCLYLPVFFTGPLINYNCFRKQVRSSIINN